MKDLRPYQKKTIADLYEWFRHNTGHPCIVMPTGSGKSHIIATLCKDAVTNWPSTKILMLTHVKELIVQNAQKLREHWPNAPLGIYSAGLNRKDLDSITFAGIQSVRKRRASQIGCVDLVIIDEAHLISHKKEGSYRKLIADLEQINPKIRVIGLTATPYRLGHGLITDKPAIFDDLIEPTTIEELVKENYLAPLRSKVTESKLSAAGVHKRGGEYIEKELQQAVDKEDKNAAIVKEIVERAEDRKAWLLFCTGVDHAYHIRDMLENNGIAAECITGKTPKKEREEIINLFKAGQIKALTNANVLTTGFDYPDIDLLVLLRPTLSPGLYTQMAGRGMRLKSHTDHCLVLDFAGVVQTHGPITAVQVPKKKGEGDGVPPSKTCEDCGEIVPASVMTCPVCGHIFPKQKKKYQLHNDDIMGEDPSVMDISSWRWELYTGKKSGKEMLRVTYYGNLSEEPIREYLTVFHGGFAGHKAMQNLRMIADKCNVNILADTIEELIDNLNDAEPAAEIEYKKDGKFYRVIDRIWKDPAEKEAAGGNDFSFDAAALPHEVNPFFL